MNKKEFRSLIEAKGIKQWEVADQLGKREDWLSRKLRKPLDPETESQVLKAIEEIEEEKNAD